MDMLNKRLEAAKANVTEIERIIELNGDIVESTSYEEGYEEGYDKGYEDGRLDYL